jgi:hypothetical protein
MFSSLPRNVSVPGFFSKLCLARSLRVRNGSQFNFSKSLEKRFVFGQSSFLQNVQLFFILPSSVVESLGSGFQMLATYSRCGLTKVSVRGMRYCHGSLI